MSLLKVAQLLVWQEKIQHYIQTLNQLNLLLKEEKIAITQNNTSQLQDIISQKNSLFGLLATADEFAKGLPIELLQNKYIDLSDDMQANQNLYKAWQQLKSTLQETRKLNDINYQVIEYSQQHINELLGILKPEYAKQTLYQANGKTYDYSVGSSLGSA